MNHNIFKRITLISFLCLTLTSSLLVSSLLTNIWGAQLFHFSFPFSANGSQTYAAYFSARTHEIAIVTNDSRFTGELTVYKPTSKETETFKGTIQGSQLFNIPIPERGFYELTITSEHEKPVFLTVQTLGSKGYDLKTITTLAIFSMAFFSTTIILWILERRKHH